MSVKDKENKNAIDGVLSGILNGIKSFGTPSTDKPSLVEKFDGVLPGIFNGIKSLASDTNKATSSDTNKATSSDTNKATSTDHTPWVETEWFKNLFGTDTPRKGIGDAILEIYNDKKTPTFTAFEQAPELKGYDTTSWGDTQAGKDAWGAYKSAVDDLDAFNPYEYTGYTKGKDVIAAENAYNAHLRTKPGEYTSQWLPQADELYQKYMNRDKFSYDMNGDALYQQYKDKYIQQGKLAMADTMGQAAAMTGGYGNSYAQSAGQQAYQGQLDNLNNIMPQLYQMALDQYNREGQDMIDQYGMLMNRDAVDYGRHRDTVSDWMTNRDYLAGRVDSALGFDYGKHMDEETIKKTLKDDEYGRLSDTVNLARGDYYDGGTIYNSEQSNKNNVTAHENEEALTKWSATNSQKWDEMQWNEEGNKTLVETAKARQAIDYIPTKDDYVARGNSESDYLSYVEDELTKLLRDDRISESDLAYLVSYYGID